SMLRPRSKCKQRSSLKHSVGVCYRVPSPNEIAREERNGEPIGSPRVEIGTARRYPMFQRFLWVRLLVRQDCRPKDDSGGIPVGELLRWLWASVGKLSVVTPSMTACRLTGEPLHFHCSNWFVQ